MTFVVSLQTHLIKALRNPRAPTVSEGLYRGMADYTLSAACWGKRAATQRHRWARANEHLVASEFREGEATARRQKRQK